MLPKPMEEKLADKWGLKDEKAILAKIFEEHTEGDKLANLLDAEKTVVCGYALGKLLALKHGLKMSQLRRFYDTLIQVKAIEDVRRSVEGDQTIRERETISKVIELKPLLAYAKARQKWAVGPFFTVVNPLIDFVRDQEDYKTLCKFVQAVIAYHKYCGGRD
jgi:CRISPR-associated protein Csm2